MRYIINYIRQIFYGHDFESRNKQNIPNNYTLGKRNERGFCDVYNNNEKTNIRLLTFTPNQSKKIKEAVDKIYKNN